VETVFFSRERSDKGLFKSAILCEKIANHKFCMAAHNIFGAQRAVRKAAERGVLENR
jgi:hypothetical protein